jgi:hypothetical protein
MAISQKNNLHEFACVAKHTKMLWEKHKRKTGKKKSVIKLVIMFISSSQHIEMLHISPQFQEWVIQEYHTH